MEHFTGSKTVKAQSYAVLDLERIRIRHKLQEEQRKLEDMVSARFKSGEINMGSDLCILNQSTVLDQLVVDEMELEELYHRYYKDQLAD